MTKIAILTAALAMPALVLLSGAAQAADTAVGRHIARTLCSECHQVGPASPQPPNSTAPRFPDIARMPSTTELSIKVFLRSSHPHMPNIMLSPAQMDAVAAYILSLAKH